MAVPTIAASGAGAVSFSTDLNVPYPAGITAGDLLFVHTVISSSVGMNIPAGWTEVRNTGATDPRAQVFRKIADGTETGNLTISTASSNTVRTGRMHRSDDADTIEAVVNNTGAGRTVSHPDITTLTADSLVCMFTGIRNDEAALSFTGETGGDLTLLNDFLTTTGSDQANSCQTADMASPGTISGGTWIKPLSDSWTHIGFAIYHAQVPLSSLGSVMF